MTRRRLVRLAAVLVGLAVLVAAAYMVALRSAVTTGDFPEGVTILNGTEITVEVYAVLRTGGEARIATLTPDDGLEDIVLGEDGCKSRGYVARTEDGTEIDRQPPPICVGEEWVITDSR